MIALFDLPLATQFALALLAIAVFASISLAGLIYLDGQRSRRKPGDDQERLRRAA